MNLYHINGLKAVLLTTILYFFKLNNHSSYRTFDNLLNLSRSYFYNLLSTVMGTLLSTSFRVSIPIFK